MDSIFISYAHADSPFLDRLNKHLKPLQREGRVDVWSDQRILAGQDWKAEIEKALVNAKVAILLLSADFLASDFIDSDELPVILDAAKSRGLTILPVIISACRFKRNKAISRFQAINDPEKPLDALPKSDQERIWTDLAARVENIVNP